MAKIFQLPYDNHITLPIETAQAVQKENHNSISLEALGLLVNLCSYPSAWELHKTELYKRFAHHGERSVKAAWNSLVQANYIIEFRYRVGKKYEYVYYYRKAPFTNEEKAEILEKSKKEYGEIFGLCKMKSPKCRTNKKNIYNKKNINNNNINKDEDMPLVPNDLTKKQINKIIDKLKKETKDDLRQSSFNAIVRKVLAKYEKGKVRDFESYLHTAIIRKIEELETRREIKRIANEKLEQARKERAKQPIPTYDFNAKEIPNYNWND